MKYNITITRQFSSYGRPIGKKIAEALGISYYDSDILTKEWQEQNLPADLLKANRQMRKREALTPLEKLMSTHGMNQWDESENRFQELSNVITYLAGKESSVFVGRCADYILEGMDNLIRIFIYAPFDVRVLNCMNQYSCSKEEARRMVVEMDSKRDHEHRRHCGYYPDDKNHQDIMINSSLLGMDRSADFLVEIIKEKFGL